MLPDIEVVSAKVHEAWMDSKRAQGVTTRKAEDGEELMAPYGDLSEKAKELDRGTVRAVYSAITSLTDEPENVAAAQARQARGEGLPGDAVVAHQKTMTYSSAYDPRKEDRRRSAHPTNIDLEKLWAKHTRNHDALDRMSRENFFAAAEEIAAAIEEITQEHPTTEPAPSKLPLSEAEIERWRLKYNSCFSPLSRMVADANNLCNQALAAINLKAAYEGQKAQVYLAELETKSLRDRLAAAEGRDSEVVSEAHDPTVGVQWMRCSPDLPGYISGLENAYRKYGAHTKDCDTVVDNKYFCSCGFEAIDAALAAKERK